MRGIIGLSLILSLSLTNPLPVYAIEDNKVACFLEKEVQASEEQASLSITASGRSVKAGETIEFSVDVKDVKPKMVKGILSQKEQGMQTRTLEFTYNGDKQAWVAVYTVTPYDHMGEWVLDVYYLEEKWHVKKNQLMLEIDNPAPKQDEIAPEFIEAFIKNNEMQGGDAITVVRGDELTIYAKATDERLDNKEFSGVQEITARVQKRGSVDAPVAAICLKYNEKADEWTAPISFSEADEAADYEVVLTIKDFAGNMRKERMNTVIHLEKEPELVLPSEDEPQQSKPQMTEKQEPLQLIEQREIPVASRGKETAFEQAEAASVQIKEKVIETKKTEAEKTASLPTSESKQTPPPQKGNSNMLFYVVGGFALFHVIRGCLEWNRGV
ncbi:MAG: hypothetical protein ACE3JP_01525 [Ectobacillus sp.]